jgi:hypothetical protein
MTRPIFRFSPQIASKLLLIALFIFFGSTATIAQTNIAVAPNKLNLLYMGIDNPVSIAASNSSDDKVTVSISGGGGTISRIGTGLYNVRVSEATDECVIGVYVDGKLAGTSIFRVRNLPAPSGTVGGVMSGANISSSFFQTQKGLGIYVINFPFEVRYEVVGYTFSVDNDKGDVKSVDCEGSYFSSTAKEYINQYVKPGRTVTIDNIRVKDAGGKEWKVPSLVYFIK